MRKLTFSTFVLIFCCITFGSNALSQENWTKVSTQDELMEDVRTGPCKNGERLEAVKKLFQKMGAADGDIRIDKYRDIQNLVVTRKGKTAETVIVGAHYDKVSSGCGTIDNWSGIVVMTHLYRSLGSAKPDKTYLFVAFDREEEGLRGSEAMVKSMTKEDRSKYCSMVNLDSFGMGYPLILENASSPKMTKFAKDLGTELKAHVDSISLAGSADADSSSFKEKDIPAITISALSDRWPQVLHSSGDKIENLLPASVRVGYLFALEYVSRIDAGPCDLFRKK